MWSRRIVSHSEQAEIGQLLPFNSSKQVTQKPTFGRHFKRNTVKLIALVIPAALFVPLAHCASFDCAKASTRVENVICNDWEISKLDVELAVRYKAALEEPTKAETIKRSQKQWLKERNVCATAECVRHAYEARLAELASTDSKGAARGTGKDVSRTDDYWLDANPEYSQGSAHELTPFEPASDPESCNVYLKNLKYFAEKNEPMSCETPVWRNLKESIQHVQWEDLDPNSNKELFKLLVAKNRFVPADKEVDPKDVNWQHELVNKREFIFRRAKIELKGTPTFDGEYGSPKALQEVLFFIVQYGDNEYVDSPRQQFACKPQRGGPAVTIQSAPYFLVTQDLHRIYGGVYSMADGAFFQDWFVINGRRYMEEKESNGDIRLSELLTKPTVILEPACLFHFHEALPSR